MLAIKHEVCGYRCPQLLVCSAPAGLLVGFTVAVCSLSLVLGRAVSFQYARVIARLKCCTCTNSCGSSNRRAACCDLHNNSWGSYRYYYCCVLAKAIKLNLTGWHHFVQLSCRTAYIAVVGGNVVTILAPRKLQRAYFVCKLATWLVLAL